MTTSPRTGAPWHSLQLGDALTAHLATGRIKEAFEQLHDSAGRPSDMAVFARHDSEGRLHCEVTAYFSPAAAAVARAFDARPCGQPTPVGLELLAGDPRCWPALFPTRSQ